MEWQQSPYFIPLIIAGLITFFTATYTFRQRHIPGVPNLLALLAGMTIWIFAYAVELNAVTLSTKLFWAKVQWLGVFYIPVGYISFILKYVGDFQRIKKPRQFTLTLLLIPLLTLLLVWTNEGHQLIWDRTEIIVYQEHTFLQLGYALGYWIFIGFAYLLLTSGTLLLLGKLFSTSTQFKGQITLFIASSLFPWLGNFLYITRINPWPYLDPTPFTFAITILCLTWAWTYYNFLDIVPVARGLVIEKLESGVIVLDGQNRVAEINATAVSLFQIEKVALIGKPLPLDGPQWASLAAALQEDRAAKFELSFDQEHYEGSVTLLENVPGELNGRLITLHNITQRIKSELLLQQAKEAAEAADHAKTHFLTNMSHEIRTPLNAVVGMAEMLRQTPLNTNQNEMIDVVAESSEDLLTLINNILDFARLEAGSLTLKQQTFDLNDCIQSSIDYVSQAANEKHLLLTYQIAEGTPTWLRGDPIRLRQILINLLENGVKFTESGEVELFVNQSHEEASVLLQFVVKDSGIGIADDQIQHIFAPFRQADGSLTRMHGGNGLGLAICQQLVSLMGGDISLTSTLGQGTAVHFTAQFSRATDAHPPTVSLRQHKATLTHKRLLVITKDANERRHISRDARIAGLKVYAAASSQEVSYWIDHSQSFDVVLLDAAVWQEEPAITTQLYHKDTSLPLPTILLISGDQDQFDITNTDANSFSGHLFSPVVSAQMYDMLLNVISTGNTTLLNHEQNQTMAERYPLNILIVEDNNTNRHVLKNMLDELGYQADVAINGQIAVQAAAQNNYDVILMDVQMPVMDGIEATRQILAACPTEKRPYIIAITAHALEGDREYYLASGMNEYLSKPIAINQLIEVLYQAVNYHDLAATRPKPASISPETIGAEEHASTLAAPIDLAELAQLVGEDTSGFLRAMAPIFLKDTEQILQNLTAAVQHTDGPEIRHAAHTLKGSSASMGMPTLSRFSRELEMMAKEGELAQAWQKLEQIQAEYSRVESALQEMVETAVKP